MCLGLRSRGSRTLLWVFLFHTAIFCNLLFPLSHLFSQLPSLSYHCRFFVLYTSFRSTYFLSSLSLSFFLANFKVLVRVCTYPDSTCTGMLKDLYRDGINHSFLQTEQFSEEEGGKQILSTLLLGCEHLSWSSTDNVNSTESTWKSSIWSVLWIFYVKLLSF